MIIDTHEHCYNPKTMDCWAANRMPEFENRDIKFVEIGINCFDIDDMIEVITKYKPCLGVVLGEHPKFITKDTDVESIFTYVIDRLLLYRNHVLGIKTGLDYHWVTDESAKGKQQELLKKFLRYAKEEKLPVVLHIRSHEDDPEAADLDMFSILQEVDFSSKMVLHCFTGNDSIAMRYLEINPNTYFGIGGAITHQECSALVAAVNAIPRQRILLETDGPYMKPFYPDMTRPAGKRNLSLNLPIVIDRLAAVLGSTSVEIENITSKNAYDFYYLTDRFY